MIKRKCTGCGMILEQRHKISFCSNRCQQEYRHRIFIKNWKDGVVDGGVGIKVRAISGHIRRYLIEKNEEKCSVCGWNQKNPSTGKVPLDVDHVDGNAENNKESNLRLLCPNCHSLTKYYKNLNKGHGRKWRMDKYIKEVVKS